MKKFFIIIIAIILIAFGLFYYFRDRRTYELDLPIYENLESISISQNDKIMVINGYEAMKDILNNISGVKRLTNIESVNDIPNENDLIKVVFHSKSKDYYVYLYKRNNKCYFEQPYNGIYRVSYDEYNNIDKYLR